ncbi:MAG: glycoside hydrolase family 38 C-terminal domain-containing protein [bacterium]
MKKPTIHMICNAHLDPVWQWRWEEGCSEALATFGNAIELINEHKQFIFNHNESVLYRWVLEYDRPLFKQIQRLVRNRRWCISGGWYLQPDVNIPGTESIIRHIAEGRQFFRKHFNVEPIVAYNFDSFGHSGGLPQILNLAGYHMYIHMRPQKHELDLPADLYRWKGVDGSEILTYRIAVGLYHAEAENIQSRIEQGIELALQLKRDVPVFWGVGNHGGGATQEALAIIDECMAREERINIIYSTTENLYHALRKYKTHAPIFQGDLQRAFTGCYTSLSRVKRRAQKGLAELVQAEALRSASWWHNHQPYPEDTLAEAWCDHLFNDFHDILPGSCIEPAEHDALDQYGRSAESVRRIRTGAATNLNKGNHRCLYIPVSLYNTNPSVTSCPAQVECVIAYQPKWTGNWHLRLYALDGSEIPCQEEQPESLLPFNSWRRRVSFKAELPQLGVSRYELQLHEGTREQSGCAPVMNYKLDPQEGLIRNLDAGGGRECLNGLLLQPLIVEDDGDAWGSDRWSYRNVIAEFVPIPERFCVIADGPIRRITESVFTYNKSTIALRTLSYPDWPVLEFQFRIQWNEALRRLKLAIPTSFNSSSLLCEVPGGAIHRPADGQEHVHGRWCMVEGEINGRKTALALINNGQHGIDLLDGELRLSVLRSAAYCHEQGLALGDTPARKFMDQGIHDIHLLVTAGDTDEVRNRVAGLAEWLIAPPLAYSHLPIGKKQSQLDNFVELVPSKIRMLAYKRSWDGKALIIRLQETTGRPTQSTLKLKTMKKSLKISFAPFEIRTLRFERDGQWKEVDTIDEH